MKQFGLRVVKLGGSLLEFDELPAALNRWLAAQPPATNLLIVGGGRLADQIRAYNRRCNLGDKFAHQLAIRAMSVTAHLLSELIGAAIWTNWSATSDSIAARIAQLSEAAELVLLKSVLPDGCHGWESAAADGFVDAHFPGIADGLSAVRCVNLRDPKMPQWRPADS